MPIPKYDNTPENEWIPKCMHVIGNEYDQSQALAICYNQMNEKMSLESLAKIPVEIIGDNEVKILEYLPTPKANELEDKYLERCVPVLYPEYFDQTMATALCADKLQRKTTVTNLTKQIKKAMKQQKMSAFEKNRLDFLVRFAEAKLRNEILLAAEGGVDYPWEDCIADQIKQYGDKDTAEKVCGAIKAKYGH